MEMKSCTAAMLLMLSLGALAAGRLSAAVADDGVDTIRLPSNGLADAVAGESGGEKKRPWGKCCDHTFCNRRMPPGCRCMDPVDRCDDACRRCEVHPSDPSKHICMDSYIGLPGPNCTTQGDGNGVSNSGDDDVDPDRCFPRCFKHGNGNDVPNEATVATTEAVSENVAAGGEEMEARPWKCCDDTLCTRSSPPTCQCRDKVKKCAKACNHCEKADDASSLYVCRDLYFGWSPKCSKSIAADDFLHGNEATVAVAATEERPWKCCDLPRCTRSFPPTCQCMDKMNKCPKTCKLCEMDAASSLIVCLDSYRGKQAPACTPRAPPPPTFTPRGN